MESFTDTTLLGISKGRAGEPSHVVALARSILLDRGVHSSASRETFGARCSSGTVTA